jgi:hypothetical protein
MRNSKWGALAAVCGLVAVTACQAVDHSDELRHTAFDTVRIIGVVDGPQYETFGSIGAVEAAGDGFVVLDGQAKTISWFDSTGRYIDGVTSAGRGPGELAEPDDIAVTSGGDIVLADRGVARISWFTRSSGGITFSRSARSELLADRLCAIGETVFIHALYSDSLIHEVAESGAVRQSFADRPQLANMGQLTGLARADAERQLAMGLISCMEDPDLVLLVPLGTTPIRAYDRQGRLRWSTLPSGHRSLAVEVFMEGRAHRFVAPPELGAHIPVSAVRWDRGVVLIQHAVRRTDVRRPDDADFHALESRFLDLESGHEIGMRSDLPLIVATDGDYAYHVRNRPVPQVIVLKRKE